jgi:hypothetical protein
MIAEGTFEITSINRTTKVGVRRQHYGNQNIVGVRVSLCLTISDEMRISLSLSRVFSGGGERCAV